MTLLQTLKRHDWYFGYSDDYSVVKRGRKRHSELRERVESLGCPYTLTQLENAIYDNVLEDFVEDPPESGKWFRNPPKYKNVAPTKRAELMPRVEHEQIMTWINNQD